MIKSSCSIRFGTKNTPVEVRYNLALIKEQNQREREDIRLFPFSYFLFSQSLKMNVGVAETSAL